MLKVHSYETFATQDGPGIRLVFFLQGCAFRCLYCQNPDTIPTGEGKDMSAENILALAEKQREYFGDKGGITFSGGEPLLQAKYLIPVLALLKEHGFNTCLDTNGYFLDDDAKECIKLADYVLPDIKQIDSEKHLKLTGKDNKNSLDFVRYLDEQEKEYWIRYVVVPGYTDGEEDIRELGNFLKELKHLKRIELLPYHNLGRNKWDKLGREYPLNGVHAANIQIMDGTKSILAEYVGEKVLIRG